MTEMATEEFVLPTLAEMKVALQEIVDRDHFEGEDSTDAAQLDDLD